MSGKINLKIFARTFAILSSAVIGLLALMASACLAMTKWGPIYGGAVILAVIVFGGAALVAWEPRGR